jgi:[glutamine synthetase] adenylyltransferase / [glutamine synthetase]-adenylyl-L-tyrosine phosphorylase
MTRAPSSRSRRSRRGSPADVRNHDPSPLLLASGLATARVAALLAPYGLTDLKLADANLQSMAGEPRTRLLLAKVLGELLASLAQTADPDQGLTHWDRFLQAGLNRSQLLDYLNGAPRILHLLCTIFGNSPSMAQTLIRDPLLVYWLAEERALTCRPSREALAASLRLMLANVTAVELQLDALRRFRRRETLRVGLRDLLKLADVPETTAALTDLACVLIQAAYEIVDACLSRQYGRPKHKDSGGRLVETGFAVIAMGKLGGGELNFSSDVDLLYVYASENGATEPAGRAGAKESGRAISNEEYFERLGRDVTKALADVTQEGHVFRVDLRLRAEGTSGQLARSLDRYAQYYRTRGEQWERMALLKAWPVAGDRSVGEAFLRRINSFIYDRSEGRDPEAVIGQVKAVKDMIDAKMAGRGQERRNVKLGRGGIREIEFIVQAAQILCGGKLPDLRDRSTMGALAKLARHRLISSKDRQALERAYVFLRNVEHKLQMVHDLQTHALPESPEELARCAIRLGYSAADRRAAGRRFLADHRRHTANVHRIFRNLFDVPARSSLVKAARSQSE